MSFDQINHNVLLSKLNTFPTIRRQIRAWLKAGVIDFSSYANREKTYSETSSGVPQGGVISPLLANIALHGMENQIKEFALTLPGDKRANRQAIGLIRFADDFVILHENLTVVQRCQQIIAEWLSEIGLELKPSKTRISHTFNKHEDNVGFDFLGFTVRHWQTIGSDNWVFKPKNQGLRLLKHRETRIVRHIQVQGSRSPFDGDWVYGRSRMGKHPEASTRVATLLKKQKGKCAYCGLFFRDEDLMEIDHKIPRSCMR